MMDALLRQILDFSGYLASFFCALEADNYLFIELAAFLALILLMSVIFIVLANKNKAQRPKHR